jgi:hypothetical protein
VTPVQIALLIAGLALLVAAPVVVLTRRYVKYERRLAQGRRHLKPVWKPFWMN